jgi:hypothetical protein
LESNLRQENVMSSYEHEQDSVIERNWQVLVILFGLTFLAILVSFNPTW